VGLTQRDVVEAAVGLLDEGGLDGLSLRRLAARLGVSAPTLYWHVRDKRALLDLMAEEIVREERPHPHPAPGQPWWEWLEERAWAQYRALLRHRDAALVIAGNRPTEESLPVIERVVGALVEVGFPPAEALESILTVGHLVIGSAVEYQAEAARGAATERDAALAVRMREAAEGTDLAEAVRQRCGPDPDRTFRHGLNLILAGLRARHRELTSG
jgi:TetR/AcrR family transcriptional regulator, tetracycline repressor protein